MEQYFREHSDNYDNIKKIISVVRFLDKCIKYRKFTYSSIYYNKYTNRISAHIYAKNKSYYLF